MKTRCTINLIAITGLAGLLCSGSLQAKEEVSAVLTKEQMDFFENKIRPILVDSCYSCHSKEADKSKGGLFLDTKAGLLEGGDTGAAVIPGDLEKSLLIEAVRRLDEDLAMPPKEKNKLSDQQVADLEKWVKMGIPDPRSGARALTPFEKLVEESKGHWAFQPVATPVLPEVKASEQVKSELDRFILKKLEENKLGFSPSASPRELIRRVYFDLVGLPPSMSQVKAFELAYTKGSKAAMESLVNELLASPHYGERWGRHWLDVARYADSMGSLFNGDDNYPNAHTYRDYVIRSFNEDKPFDQFVIEQLAADQLEVPKEDNRVLAAMGLLTVGRKERVRTTDNTRADQIDVISRGLMGLTVGCARCHDHKLEPISTKDYYSLYGILRSSEEPPALPELKPLPETPELKEYRTKNIQARKEFIRVYAFEAERILTANYARVGDYLLAVHEGKLKRANQDEGRVLKAILDPRSLHSGFYDALVQKWEEQVKGHPKIFQPWVELSALPPEDFAENAPTLCKKYAENKNKAITPGVATAFEGLQVKSLQDIAWAYNGMFALVDRQWGERFRGALRRNCEAKDDELGIPEKELAKRAVDRIQKAYLDVHLKEDDPHAQLMSWLATEGYPFAVDGERFIRQRMFGRDVAKGVRRDAKTAVVDLNKHPGAPPRAMIMTDAAKLYDSKVFVRGNPTSFGEPAPRQFFEFLAGKDQESFPKDKSGRLEFARAIVSVDNPLTARVIVNRVWQWHFGEGLVRTPSDFGLRGKRPTHPQLLDYLTSCFVNEGWSIKKLHRWMMLSTTYQQSSHPVIAAEINDPENLLWRRMNARALEFEAFRDNLLVVSDRIDFKAGGRSDDIVGKDAGTTRRTVYARVDRKVLPNLFRSFDFPDPSFTAPQRKRSALTPESLFLLNSPFIVENAKAITKLTTGNGKSEKEAIARLYQRLFQRKPSEAEVSRSLKFLAAYPKGDKVIPEATDWLYGYGEFDAVAGKVKGFTSLSKFSGETVKGIKQKDMDLSGMEINAKGGKVAQDRATIRRWTAPYAGTVNIYAELLHNNLVEAADGKPQPKPEGDGVNCHVVSSNGGKLGTWSAFNTAVMTLVSDITVKPGDTLDFVTLCGDDSKGDTFTWAPTITMKDRDIPSMRGMAMRWDARTNFMDPSKMPEPIGPWEELAQVLLLSNEFAVVD